MCSRDVMFQLVYYTHDVMFQLSHPQSPELEQSQFESMWDQAENVRIWCRLVLTHLHNVREFWKTIFINKFIDIYVVFKYQ